MINCYPLNRRMSEGKLTLHIHVGCLVHKMHKKLGGADEDLVSTVSDGAVPPCALKYMNKKQKQLKAGRIKNLPNGFSLQKQ